MQKLDRGMLHSESVGLVARTPSRKLNISSPSQQFLKETELDFFTFESLQVLRQLLFRV